MTPPEPPRAARAVLWSIAAALFVRLVYLIEHTGSAFFGFAVLDEAYYDGAARALLAGDAASVLGDGFRPPLYPLFLAACYRIGGDGLDLAVAVLVQHGLGALTAGMAAWLAVRLIGPHPNRPSTDLVAGLAAGLFVATAGPMVFFGGERLIVTLFTFLLTLGFVLAVRALASPTLVRWAAVGAVLGLTIQARGNAVLLVPLMLLAAFWSGLRRSQPHDPRPRHGLVRTVAAFAGLFAILLGFAALRQAYRDDFQLLPSAGGINLYLGNERGADGIVPRQDRAVTYGDAYRDSVAVFAAEAYDEARARGEVTAAPTPSRISRYWTRRTLDEFRADPTGRARLLGHKALLIASNRELPNNKTYEFIVREESTLLGWLPTRWCVLLAFAPLGAVYAFRRGDRSVAIYLGLGLVILAGGVALFFVNSRFRLPLWPPMAALAGVGVVVLRDAIATITWGATPPVHRRRTAVVTLLAIGLPAALSLVIAHDLELPGAGRDRFFRSLAHLERGNIPEARADAEQAAARRPRDAAVLNQLGNVRLAEDDPQGALDAYRKAAAIRPDEPRVHNNLGVALERLDQPGAAQAAYLEAIRREPTYPPPWLNLALLSLRAGLDQDAALRLSRFDHLIRHPNAAPPSPQRRAAGIVLAQRRGDLDTATRLLASTPELERDTVRRVIEDLGRPVDPASLTATPRTDPDSPSPNGPT